MLERFKEDFKTWAARPYRDDGDLVDWLLFIGLLTVGTILWTRVIKEVIE
jgi:hypothetical protein